MATMSGWRITRAGIVFILVALLLVGAVIGASYLLRERGEQVRQQEAAEIAQENLENESNDPVVIARDKPETVDTNGETGEGSGAPVPEELPETGPTEFGAFIASVLLAASVAAFLQSRQALIRASIRS